jgi:hypothetical protein
MPAPSSPVRNVHNSLSCETLAGVICVSPEYWPPPGAPPYEPHPPASAWARVVAKAASNAIAIGFIGEPLQL